jgi:lipid-A-disaccharide synthase-like uncharacterized protein
VSIPDGLWLAIGLAGQTLFSLRFLVQWISSEREGRSVIPVAFWYLSIAGSLTLLAYALHRRDLVFTLGQGAGVLIYARNIALVRARPVTDLRA